MLKVYTCIATQHDLRLVCLAALVCTLASFTAVNLLHHVGRSERAMRRIWLAVAAVATGFGIWSTHFIAMLAFQPAVPSGYNIALTIASLVAAIALTGTGLTVGMSPRVPYARWIGGAIVGGGIAVMHYTGMAAFEIAGRVVWDLPLVAASIALGGLFGAAALPVALRSQHDQVEGTWRAGTYDCDLQPSFHGDGRGCDCARSSHRRFGSGAASGLDGDRRGAGFDRHHSSGPCRPCSRSARSSLAPGRRRVCRSWLTPPSKGWSCATRRRSSQPIAASPPLHVLRAPGASAAPWSISSPPSRRPTSRDAQKPLEVELCATDGRMIPVELIRHSIIYAGKQHQVSLFAISAGVSRLKSKFTSLLTTTP